MQRVVVAILVVLVACGTKTIAEAETKGDVAWLSQNPTGDAVAALGRLADKDPAAIAALQTRADRDVNVYIAAWTAVTRGAPWGTTFLKSAIADPAHVDMATDAMPRKDARLTPFIPELEAAMVRLASGRRGSLIAGMLASIGPDAHAAIEKRLADPKSRGAMCDGIAVPEASADAKATLLSVPTESRNDANCVGTVIRLATSDDGVVSWIATKAEPGMLGAAATTSQMPCARLALVWNKALLERGSDSQAAMAIPLQRSISRCGRVIDPVLAELMNKAPRARPTIIAAIDPYGPELAELKATCATLRAGAGNGEAPMLRLRAQEAVRRGCSFAR